MTLESKITSGQRLRALRQSIVSKGFVRILEAHSGLSGIVGQRARVEKDEAVIEYDGLWVSSLTESASKGLPDVSLLSYDARIHTIDEILHVTTLGFL